MHHGGAFGQVSAQAYTVGISNSDSTWHDVVGHAGNLSIPEDRELLPFVRARRRVSCMSATGTGPRFVHALFGEQPEDPIEIDRARCDETVRQQVQAQVDVSSVSWRFEGRHDRPNGLDSNLANRIERDSRTEPGTSSGSRVNDGCGYQTSSSSSPA